MTADGSTTGTGSFEERRVVITGAARDFGRTLAITFAELGAEVFVSARDVAGARRTREEAVARGAAAVHAFGCDLSRPASVREFAGAVAAMTDQVDVLINNGAGWLDAPDIESVSDEEIMSTISSGAVGTVLMVKHFLPLLRASSQPDIVNMISSAALPNYHGCVGHEAFYTAKGGQGKFADILSQRLRPEGIRVISLYPPDFNNLDPLSPEWHTASREAKDVLTSKSLVECIFFALRQPRDCFIRSFEFEQGEQR
jgi:NAD(P)-dependent dehydrogenase (short-subunit alcohol dehydrogenase family)